MMTKVLHCITCDWIIGTANTCIYDVIDDVRKQLMRNDMHILVESCFLATDLLGAKFIGYYSRHHFSVHNLHQNEMLLLKFCKSSFSFDWAHNWGLIRLSSPVTICSLDDFHWPVDLIGQWAILRFCTDDLVKSNYFVKCSSQHQWMLLSLSAQYGV